MSRIFISYRAKDSAAYARNLESAIEVRFGEGSVFTDRAIKPADDVVERIHTAVASCDLLLAIIADRWLTVVDPSGRRRLDDPNDWVRLEIEGALARGVPVMPVLVAGAGMPVPAELPESLKDLARQKAAELREERWEHDLERMLTAIQRASAESPKEWTVEVLNRRWNVRSLRVQLSVDTHIVTYRMGMMFDTVEVDGKREVRSEKSDRVPFELTDGPWTYDAAFLINRGVDWDSSWLPFKPSKPFIGLLVNREVVWIDRMPALAMTAVE